jgi:hypothetical protein
MWHRIYLAFREFFFALPSVAGLLLATLAVALGFVKESEKFLEPKKTLRIWLAISLVIVGGGAFASDLVQRAEDQREKEAAIAERKILLQQNGQLIAASQIQATSDDIHKLDAHITDGFLTVVAVIKGVKAPTKTTPAQNIGPQLPPALAQNLTFTQRRAPSSDPSLPYGLQIIIQSNITIRPVGFAFACTGEVGKIDFFIAGQSAYLSVTTGISGEKKNIPFVKFAFPPLVPETPLVVTLLSKEDIRVTEVQQIH